MDSEDINCTEAVKNKSSEQYKKLEKIARDAIQSIAVAAKWGQYLVSAVIKNLKCGSLIVYVEINMTANATMADTLNSSFNGGYASLSSPGYSMDTSFTSFHEVVIGAFYDPEDDETVQVSSSPSTLQTSTPIAITPLSASSACTNSTCVCGGQECTSVVPSETTVPEDPCLYNPCPSHSTCWSDGSYYNCTCHSGYTSRDQRCLDVDECQPSPCSTNAQCTNTAGSYFCSCLSGFESVGSLCNDVNECVSDLCPPHSNCSNTLGSYSCLCHPGFQLSQGLCHNVDECTSNPCPARATCVDTPGSFTCTCQQGFVLRDNLCQDVNECSNSETCPANAVCNNTEGTYTCTCNAGYSDFNGLCLDVDECKTNPCPAHAKCVNTPGSYSCACFTGFYNNSGLCIDVDECSQSGKSPCTEHAHCTNSQGSYTCVCQQGFQQQLDLCEDIDECSSSPCSQFSSCLNTAGNYSCVCQNDFFQDDPYTCLQARSFEITFPAPTTALQAQPQVDSVMRTNLASVYLGTTLWSSDPNSASKRLFVRFTPQSSAGVVILQSLLTSWSYNVQDVNECTETGWADCSAVGSNCSNTEGSYTCDCDQAYVDYSPDVPGRPGRRCFAIDDSHQQPITNMTVSTSADVFEVGSNVTLTLAVREGSHVTFYILFGDGESLNETHPNILSFQSAVTVSHVYSVAKDWTIIVRASNTKGIVESQEQITVIEPVRNLILKTTELVTSSNSTFRFDVAIAEAGLVLTNLTCTFDFGDGDSELKKMDIFSENDHVTVEHSYYLGVFEVTVTCTNGISSLPMNSTVIAEERITGLSVKSDRVYGTIGHIFHLSVTTTTGSNLVMTFSAGNGLSETRAIGNNKRGDSVVPLSVKYSEVKSYRVMISARNLLSNDTAELSHRIHVLNIVKDLTLTVPVVISYPPGVADAVIEYKKSSLPPTNVSCDVSSPNLPEHTYFSEEISLGNSLNFSSRFDNISAVGTNNVVINCSNVLSYQVFETSILMEAVITKVEVTVSKTYIMVKGAVDVNVTVGTGSHAQYRLDFGEGDNVTGVFTSTILHDKTLTFWHAYVRAGLYNVTFFVSNRVSEAVAVKMVGVLEEVTDVEVTAGYQPLDHNLTLQGGHGPQGNIFPLEREVVFRPTQASGNDITYTWDFKDGTPLTSSRDTEMRHRFSKAGQYRVKVNASNALFHDVDYTLVVLYQTVLMHTLSNDGPTDAYRTVNFTLQLARAGTESCFIWNMRDGSEEYVYGASDCSKYTQTPSWKFKSLQQSLTTSLQLRQSHMYQTNQTFYIVVRAYNLVSQGHISDVAIVSGISCHLPRVHLLGGGQMIDKPVVHHRSAWISMESTVDINCEVTQEADYSWKTHQVLTEDNFLDFYFKPVTVKVTSAGLFKVLFAPAAFEAGTYRVSLNVSMKGIPGLFHSDFAYIRIDPTPLVSSIIGGTARSLGYDKQFVVDATSGSHDPDLLNPADKTGLYFRWFCRRPNEVLLKDPEIVRIPTNLSETDFNVTRGCFGTGPGQLAVSNVTGVLHLNSYLMQFGSTNVFSVRVVKEDGTGRTAQYEQSVTIVAGDPPDLTIKCVTNCKSKVNPSGEFTLSGHCSKCRPLDVVAYSWTLSEELKNGSLVSVTIPSNATTTGLSSPGISFKSKFLIGGKTYRLRVYGALAGYSTGFSEFRFVSNLPPYGGNCSINPQKGYALDTHFVINCYGWLNPGEEEALGLGILYRFLTKPHPGQQNEQLLYYGTDPYTPECQLPLGLDTNYPYDVKVRISNAIGEYVEQLLAVQVTRPPAKLELSTIETLAKGENSDLSVLLTSGREQEAKQLIVALASLLNTGSSVFTRITTTTTTTTPAPTTTTTATTTTTTITTSTTTSTTSSTAEPTTTAATTFSKDNTTTVDAVSASDSPSNASITVLMTTTKRTTVASVTTTEPPPATTTTASTTTETTTAATTAPITTTTTTATTTIRTTTVLVPPTERSEEEKKALTEMRTVVVKALSQTTTTTLDSLQQTATAIKFITDQTDEISEECQLIAVKTMQNMTSVLKVMVEEDRLQSVEQELSAAEDIVASLGNILAAATDGVDINVLELFGEDDSASATLSSTTLSSVAATTNTSTSPSPPPSAGGGGTTTTAAPTLPSKREQVRELTKKTMEMTDTIVTLLLKRRVVGEPPLELYSRLFTIHAARRHLAGFNNSVHSAPEGAFVFPSVDKFDFGNDTSFVDTKFLTTNKNPFMWDASAKEVTSPVVSMNLYDNKGKELKVTGLTEPIHINISTGISKGNVSRVTPFLVDDAQLHYHEIFTTWNSSEALSIVITPEPTNETLEVFLKHGSQPTPTDFEWTYRFPDEDGGGDSQRGGGEDVEYKIFIRNDSSAANDTDVLYLGLRVYVNESMVEPDYGDYYTDPDEAGVRNESLPPYTIIVFGSSCRYWDEGRETWATDGCQVSEDSTEAVTCCLCTHLTSFGAGVLVAPNQIHFDTVFSDLGSKLTDNYAVLVTLCLVFFLYVLGLVWARRMDRKDVEKWGATPLADNVQSDNYFYRVTVFTGARYGAGTRSKVSFVLSGDKGDTGVRQLADEEGKKTLSRGTITQYVLGVQGDLGPLSYLRVWHDNSGTGLHQGWYLSKIIVTDLQTASSYIFLCNRWLAVEEEDGHVDRILPVAGREDLVDFQHLFFTQTQRSLSDTHLWVSVFSRPRRSRFSRVQRLSCILCLLLATMMADAMFYQAGGGADSESGALEVGPVKVTIQELYVSFISSLIILPLNLLIDQIFRRSRPKAHKTDLAFMGVPEQPVKAASKEEKQQQEDIQAIRSRIFQVVGDCPDLSQWYEDGDVSKTSVEGGENGSGKQQTNTLKSEADPKTPETDQQQTRTKQKPPKKRKMSSRKMLPHWCMYVGWLLVLGVSGVSAFITFSYSMQWGRDKSLAWLAAMVLSVSQSILLVQPVKIIVLALLMAWACKKPKEEEEEEEEGEAAGVVDASEIQLKSDEEPISYMPRMEHRPHLAAPAPDSEALAESRAQRQKEMATSRVTREIVAYLTYLLLLILVAAHNRDSRSFLWTNSIRTILNSGPAVAEVSDYKLFWNWTRQVMVPNLYTETDYRGQLLPEGGSRVISTMTAYRLGPVRLRQHRVNAKPCRPPKPFLYQDISCTQTWSWDVQETGTFLEGWRAPPDTFYPAVNFAWTYLDWTQTDGIPYVGAIAVYPAGGYVKDLIGSRRRVEGFLADLEEWQWVDQYTRSLFVEMVLYNPNINLFAMVTVVFETPLTGKLQGQVLVHPFRLFSYLGGYGVFVVFCEALIILCTIYFLCREAKKLWTQRLHYFGQFWNWMELGSVLGSVTAIVMYAGRHVLTKMAMGKVKALRGKFYNFQRLAQWDELFSYLLAFVSFLAILKTVHLLRFNRRVSMLGCTLQTSAKDLSSFVIVFFFFFVAFFSSGVILFGSQLPDYSSVVTTVETLMAVCLGQAQFQVLDEANRILGPLYFFCYMMFVVFVLLNMFLTILNETFSAVRHDLSMHSNDYEVVEFMLKNLKGWLGSIPWKAFFSGQKGKYSDEPSARESSLGDLDPSQPGSFEPLSILQLLQRQMETDFEHLGPDRRDLRSPLGFDSLDLLGVEDRPFRLRSAFARKDDLNRFRFRGGIEDDADDDDDDVEILKY